MQFLPNISDQSLDTAEFNTCKINSTNSVKYLGIIIVSSLTWKEHNSLYKFKAKLLCLL
jgi:hypothetical protein